MGFVRKVCGILSAPLILMVLVAAPIAACRRHRRHFLIQHEILVMAPGHPVTRVQREDGHWWDASTDVRYRRFPVGGFELECGRRERVRVLDFDA
eukprot:CAMPEP_0198530238 /NCGR_PEP_ID=MMETSP1462-20131121/26239_1 /TAXON_ID=1333877 /ORGANISM="Brandtodinium nutriculum, Strain RCC3387" /LENGTH=94 /DNA_ID=CAMNT_0044260109 /DNA_START=1 /DNA_END=285 /DNA_ORIENTATION=-